MLHPFILLVILPFLFCLGQNLNSNSVSFPSTDDSSNRSRVIWMVPSWQCKGSDAIDVQRFGILQNQNQKFVGGEHFAIFYEHTFGKIPYFHHQNPLKAKNGGLPQLGNIEEHLKIAEKDIEKTIPDKMFNGIAVIDIEEFRPNWELSWGVFSVYQRESIKLVRKRMPEASQRLVEKTAKLEYETACKKFFLETLRLGKKLRPHAKWGYYLFPKCNGDVAKTGGTHCSANFQQYNNNLYWLWSESTALFPSVYLYPHHRSSSDMNTIWTGASIMETRRIQKIYCPKCEIHVFTKIEYDPYYHSQDFYSKANLGSTLEVAMKMNIKNVVIWSTSTRIKNRCGWIRDYVRDTLGPYLELIEKTLDSCRVKRCSSHGECFMRKAKRLPNLFDYQCKCDAGYRGDSCQRGQRVAKNADDMKRLKYNSPNRYYYIA